MRLLFSEKGLAKPTNTKQQADKISGYRVKIVENLAAEEPGILHKWPKNLWILDEDLIE